MLASEVEWVNGLVLRARGGRAKPCPRRAARGTDYQSSGLRSAHGRTRSSCAESDIRVASSP